MINNNYYLLKIEDIKLLINLNIISLMNEYNEFEAMKYKGKILIIIIQKNDIIILSSKEIFNDYYQWYWNINDDEILVQNKNFKITKELKKHKNICLSLDFLNKKFFRKER